jgi:hypothetical protein
MTYLLHCIVEQGLEEPGAQSQGISLVAGHGLAAVVSQDELDEPPTVARLLAYERVVESIHTRQTVLPLRYGCRMESEAEILRLLEERRQEYEALLKRLRGMTEMGIRLLWSARVHPQPAAAASPGAAYLASLRQRYEVGGTLMPEEVETSSRIAGLLADLFAEQRSEVSSSPQGRLLSLAFLTPRVRVEEFRGKAREITPPGGAKLLLSGPWPPYSFVSSIR